MGTDDVDEEFSQRRGLPVAHIVGLAVVGAVLVVGMFVAGGLVTLGPGDGTSLLVTTDGQTIVVTDTDGRVLGEYDPPNDAVVALPISRLAVRPGSTMAELTVAYADRSRRCRSGGARWMSVSGGQLRGGALDDGLGACTTDLVWTPSGDALWWGEADGSLRIQRWGPDGPGDAPADVERHPYSRCHPPSEEEQACYLPLFDGTRAISGRWLWAGGDDEATDGALWLPGSRVLPVRRGVDGTIRPRTELTTEEEVDAALGAVYRPDPAWPLWSGYKVDWNPGYTAVVLSRFDGDGEPASLPLPPGIVTGEDIDRSAVWLSAGDDLAVFGVGGDAWAAPWTGGRWGALTALPGVVHADVLALPDDGLATPPADPRERTAQSPEAVPGERPGGFAFVAADSEAITLHAPQGDLPLARFHPADHAPVFALRPGSTVDDLTLVWREREADDRAVEWRESVACEAALRWIRVVEGVEDAGGTLPATCPGRPVFSPDGGHLAWVSQRAGAAPGTGRFAVQTVEWQQGPGAGPRVFVFEGDRADTREVELVDWTWAQDGATPTVGLLHMAGFDLHGGTARTLAIQRRTGGALAVAPDATAEQVVALVPGLNQEGLAILQADGGEPDRPRYTLEADWNQDMSTDVRLVRTADGQRDELALSDESLPVRAERGAESIGRPWMTARGNDVLLGDGQGTAWRAMWTGEGWSQLRAELGGSVLYAVPLVLGQQPSGQASIGEYPATGENRVMDGAPTPAEEPPSGEQPLTAEQPSSHDFSYIASDHTALILNSPQGRVVLATPRRDIMDFAVHPNSTPEDLEVVWRDGEGADATLSWGRFSDGVEVAGGIVPARTSGRPVFSPDGTHLAWTDGQRSGGGGVHIQTLAWSRGPSADEGPTRLAVPGGQDLDILHVADWVWTEGLEPETAGLLHVVVTEDRLSRDRGMDAYALPIKRGASGELVLPAPPHKVEGALVHVDSHLSDGTGDAPTFQLTRVPGGDDALDLAITRTQGTNIDRIVLPPGLLWVEGPRIEHNWLRARGDDVLFGDGSGRGFRLPWTPDGWAHIRLLEGAGRHAVPLDTRGSP